MDFTAIFQQNKLSFLFMGLIFIGAAVFNVLRMKKIKASAGDFLKEHPDAAKVYLVAKAFITSEAVTVISVDGAAPVFFVDGVKTGFYAVPGSRNVEMQYTYNRPGIAHKNVMTTVGPVKKELALETGKSYMLGYDRGADVFTLNELE